MRKLTLSVCERVVELWSREKVVRDCGGEKGRGGRRLRGGLFVGDGEGAVEAALTLACHKAVSRNFGSE